MLPIFFAYVLTIPVLMAFDLSWLGFVAKGFYQSRLGFLPLGVIWPAAAAFYIIFTAGLFYFVSLPGWRAHSLSHTILLGALFGFFTYATYDLTNMATLIGWPLSITIIDIAWGTLLGGILGAASYGWLLLLA